MRAPFEVRPTDRDFYERNLKDFLPEKIIDIHTHIWLGEFRNNSKSETIRSAKWPSMVAQDNSIEDLLETYRLMLPDKNVSPVIFAYPENNINCEQNNRYVKQCADRYGLPALLLALPDWSAKQLEERVIMGGYFGVKVYLNYAPAYIPQDSIRIFDFLPHYQLEAINAHGWIVMLHIPGSKRLRDPENISQIIEITQRYPKVKLIIAHVGRAYCIEDIGNALEVLSKVDAESLYFDISANTNSAVFEQLIRAIGSKRILFGSDLPILRMRSRRICENGNYINLVQKGMYGDVSGDSHMREVTGDEQNRLTFFLYEEIDAFRRAAAATGLTRSDIEDVFFNNAAELLDSRTGRAYYA
jgi:predicted TIM-barrel fold metal-dependent hydrolase